MKQRSHVEQQNTGAGQVSKYAGMLCTFCSVQANKRTADSCTAFSSQPGDLHKGQSGGGGLRVTTSVGPLIPVHMAYKHMLEQTRACVRTRGVHSHINKSASWQMRAACGARLFFDPCGRVGELRNGGERERSLLRSPLLS